MNYILTEQSVNWLITAMSNEALCNKYLNLRHELEADDEQELPCELHGLLESLAVEIKLRRLNMEDHAYLGE